MAGKFESGISCINSLYLSYRKHKGSFWYDLESVITLRRNREWTNNRTILESPEFNGEEASESFRKELKLWEGFRWWREAVGCLSLWNKATNRELGF